MNRMIETGRNRTNRKHFEAIVMSETKDENRIGEDEILAETIRYVVARSRGIACRYPAEENSKNSQESIKDLHRRWVNYVSKEERFVCENCSI